MSNDTTAPSIKDIAIKDVARALRTKSREGLSVRYLTIAESEEMAKLIPLSMLSLVGGKFGLGPALTPEMVTLLGDFFYAGLLRKQASKAE